jgi:HEAT repeat protein
MRTTPYVSRVRWFVAFLILVLLVTGCSPLGPGVTLPTAPSTLSTVVDALSSPSAGVRVSAALAVPNFGEEAIVAVPLLIRNLYFETNSEVREAAAFALGKLGPLAQDAVPHLVIKLRTEVSHHPLRAAARALGEIGSPAAVPALAECLYKDDSRVDSQCAEALAAIVEADFSDMDAAYLNQEGVPFIVVAAREWWEETGQYQDWGETMGEP